MSLYGYARVSTLDQDLAIQRAALKAAGCEVIRAEKVSGTRRRERQLEGISAAKARGVYKGRKPTIDAGEVRRLRDDEKLGPAAIARQLGIGRASVYRLLGKRRRTGVTMPIKAEMRWFYPIDWPQLSRQCGSSAPTASVRAAGGRMAQLFAVCRTDAGLTPPVKLRAVIVDGSLAGPTPRRQPGYGRRVSSLPRRISITIRATIGLAT